MKLFAYIAFLSTLLACWSRPGVDQEDVSDFLDEFDEVELVEDDDDFDCGLGIAFCGCIIELKFGDMNCDG